MANHGYIALANPTIAEFVSRQPEGTIQAVLYQMDGGILQVDGSSLSVFVVSSHKEFSYDFAVALARLEGDLNKLLDRFEYVEVSAIPKVVAYPADLEELFKASDAFPVDVAPGEWS